MSLTIYNKKLPELSESRRACAKTISWQSLKSIKWYYLILKSFIEKPVATSKSKAREERRKKQHRKPTKGLEEKRFFFLALKTEQIWQQEVYLEDHISRTMRLEAVVWSCDSTYMYLEGTPIDLSGTYFGINMHRVWLQVIRQSSSCPWSICGHLICLAIICKGTLEPKHQLSSLKI